MNSVFEALSLLTPYDIDKPKRRIGPRGDGGYVFVDDITTDQTILSYGIGLEYRFDAEMAALGHQVYMFDHTIDGIDATHPNMRWFKEGVGHTHPEARLYSIGDHLQRLSIRGDRLILKIDVEGAEFDAFAGLDDATLARFEQIVMEVHWLAHLEDPGYREAFVRMFKTLNRQFTLFHVHANNFDGPNGLAISGGLPVSNLLELSYVRTASVQRRPNRTLYPTALDFPNTGQKDKLLWFYPFLPTGADLQDFRLCEQRVDYVERMRLHGLPA
jgi:FkbM family methyltransferase